MLSTFCNVIFWVNPRKSLVILLLFNVLAYFFHAYWLSGCFAVLTCYMLSRRSISILGKGIDESAAQPTIARTPSKGFRRASSSDTPVDREQVDGDDASLGTGVQRIATVMPRPYKEICQSLQPVLKLAADACQLVHDLFTWNHPSSSQLLGAVASCAIFSFLISPRILTMLIGSFVLLICSPVPVAVSGCIAYARWLRVRTGTIPKAWRVSANYDAVFSSHEYAAASAQSDEAVRSISLGIKLRNAGLQATRNVSSRYASKAQS